MIDVTIISCLYGDTHDGFVREWEDGILRLDPSPAAVIVGTDSPRTIAAATVKPRESYTWHHPKAFLLQVALECVGTEWVWQHDIDDVAFPDALDGLEDVTADVWQMGYVRSPDGEVYIPPKVTAADVIDGSRNLLVGTSCVRTAKLREVGGFPDVALEDWALWRNLAHAGATFETSGRTHFHYRRHQQARGARELSAGRRPEHLEEMLAMEDHLAPV